MPQDLHNSLNLRFKVQVWTNLTLSSEALQVDEVKHANNYSKYH